MTKEILCILSKLPVIGLGFKATDKFRESNTVMLSLRPVAKAQSVT
jgi:hypothetical protein